MAEQQRDGTDEIIEETDPDFFSRAAILTVLNWLSSDAGHNALLLADQEALKGFSFTIKVDNATGTLVFTKGEKTLSLELPSDEKNPGRQIAERMRALDQFADELLGMGITSDEMRAYLREVSPGIVAVRDVIAGAVANALNKGE